MQHKFHYDMVTDSLWQCSFHFECTLWVFEIRLINLATSLKPSETLLSQTEKKVIILIIMNYHINDKFLNDRKKSSVHLINNMVCVGHQMRLMLDDLN
jgi:hypothetical protein